MVFIVYAPQTGEPIVLGVARDAQHAKERLEGRSFRRDFSRRCRKADGGWGHYLVAEAAELPDLLADFRQWARQRAADEHEYRAIESDRQTVHLYGVW